MKISHATNLRAVATQIIREVIQGSSLSDSLNNHLSLINDERDRAWLKAICYGVCRFYTHLESLLKQLLKKPIKAKDEDLQTLCLVGLYQLTEMRIPAHAVIHETVAATKAFNKSWASGLINAILRNFVRRQTHLLKDAQLEKQETFVYAHPTWWIDAIRKDWPDCWQQILLANNQLPPLSLRVNQQRNNRLAYVSLLEAKRYQSQMIPETTHGITLNHPIAHHELPNFFSGDVSYQDGAAQLAAGLLNLAPNQRVLDACAAPGGKLTHILESNTALADCVAIEKDPKRITLIHENLSRMGLKNRCQCICADVSKLDTWWDGQLFDRVLLDVPCSASGVIRRHPDIKLLRKPSDIRALAKEQQRLLQTVWQVLKSGGMLVYATCSIFHEENVQVLKRFLAEHTDAVEQPIHEDWGLGCEIGRQILPGMHNMDGFYYARLQKKD